MAEVEAAPGGALIEIGSGQGRLAIGLAYLNADVEYLGIDVAEPFVRWCKENIEALHPTFRFVHVNLVNARYNPDGTALEASFRLPVNNGVAGVVYLWGVVTNMEPEHLRPYASEISRMLKPGGRMFLTANVEKDVPEISINPEGYTPFSCSGPLHIVRYELDYFVGVFAEAGLEMTRMDHHAAGNCQSELYFVKRAFAPT